MSKLDHNKLLRQTNEIALEGVKNGKLPFGALLADQDGNVLMTQDNIEGEEKGTGHAEATLVRRAVVKYDPEFLWNCTLYTSVEPCVMCSGCVYWGNIGQVVFGVTEAQLLELTGNHEDNPTMSLPCWEVFERGQKDISVIGPVAEVSDELLEIHRKFW